MSFLMLSKKNLNLLVPVMIVVAITFGLITYHRYEILDQKKIAIYSIKKHSAWDFIVGKQHVLITDSILTSDQQKIDYHLKNSRIKWGIDDNSYNIPNIDTTINDVLFTDCNFLHFSEIRIFISDGSKRFFPMKSKLPLDIVIISGRKRTDINQLLSVFDFKRIIIDSSVPWWNQKNIIEASEKQGIRCYNVNKDGALVINM